MVRIYRQPFSKRSSIRCRPSSTRAKEQQINTLDISDLNYAELLQLRQSVGNRLKDMRDTASRSCAPRSLSKLNCVELKELIPKKTRKRRSKDDDLA